MPDMADLLFSAMELAQFEGDEVTIELSGMRLILTEEELALMDELSVTEQILLTLSAVGMADVTEAALDAMDAELSEAAQALDARIAERISAMDEAEQAALAETLDAYFPLEEAEIDGQTRQLFTLELQIDVDGEARVQRYSFALQEDGSWAFADYEVKQVNPVG